MGNPIIDPAGLIDGKWYYCEIIAWEGVPIDTCTGDHLYDYCCQEGSVIQLFLDSGQCDHLFTCCPYAAYMHQRLLCTVGPYDNAAACRFAHGL